jgi:LacI family transcriptional regulator
MANIQDVAKKAGVAPITVSRVINNSGYASQATRKRVEAAIAELGFVPNTLARSLRSGHTNTLALVMTDITNPFFTTLARGVEDTASAAGYTVIFCNTDESEEKERQYLQVLLQKRVDGILLVPARSAPFSVRFVQEHDTAVVVVDRRVPEVKADVVRCDSEGGAYQLAKLLVRQGHRRIAMFSGPHGVSTSEDRVSGCLRAFAEAGLGEDACQVYYGAFTQENGYALTQQVMAANPRPTAEFAGNNFIAIGTQKALRDLGLHVPEDIALVGFDDLPPALVTFPILTVAAQPAYAMGQKATELLLARLSGNAPEEWQEIILPTEIIVRQSSQLTLPGQQIDAFTQTLP